ncbi:MAG: NAD(P)-dependent oxidoreductase, partial [Actinobacteria bacterium]|nr:NAD(P)-dependent oxidoreductase [Actinomycetota bacterium]
MNKILLTGSSGFVGSYLTTHFNSIDLSIFGLSINGGYDISNYESISRIEGEYDLFIHCASAFNGDDIDSCIQNEMINSIGALNICKLALKIKCRFFIYFSSISVIENPANEYYNSYGISKKHAEDNIIFFCKKNNIKCLILRFSQIYDSEGKAKHHQPFLYNIIEKVKNDEEILIYGSKNPVRNFIHIDDVCEIVTQSFNKKLEGSYHCIHPNSY